MPYVTEWEDPQIFLRQGAVVLHEYYLDGHDECPSAYEFAIYEPLQSARDGTPVFGDLEYEEPVEIVDVFAICDLLGLARCPSPSPDWCRARLCQAINAGILTQKGLREPGAGGGPYWGKDTMTAALPLEGESVCQK
jgi:hypothetical protein